MEAEDYAYSNEYHAGMIVRDKLAESAMVGILSATGELGFNYETVAQQSYQMADAMIKQSKI